MYNSKNSIKAKRILYSHNYSHFHPFQILKKGQLSKNKTY